MFKMTVKIPRQMSLDQIRWAPLNTLRRYARDVSRDLNATVESWTNAPEFVAKIGQARGEQYTTAVTVEMKGNEDAKKHWMWANDGVRQHPIAAVNGPRLHYQVDFTAKTTPKSFSSRAGGKSGNWTHPRQVTWKPRVEGRHWTEALAQKYGERFGLDIIQAYQKAFAKMVAQANAGATEK